MALDISVNSYSPPRNPVINPPTQPRDWPAISAHFHRAAVADSNPGKVRWFHISSPFYTRRYQTYPSPPDDWLARHFSSRPFRPGPLYAQPPLRGPFHFAYLLFQIAHRVPATRPSRPPLISIRRDRFAGSIRPDRSRTSLRHPSACFPRL